MSAITDSLWCESCAAVTAHEVLADRQFECHKCGAVRTWHLSDGLYGTGWPS